MRQMGGQDASFVYNEAPRMPMHIAGLAIYDPSTANGPVTFKGILDHIRARMPLVPTYYERMVRVPFDYDHPWWVVDPEFDLEFHVRHIALPHPGDWRQLCIQAARLHARELDLDRPLWEMYVIEGLDNVEGVPPGSFAVVTKTHHAAVDGVSGVELASIINDLEPDAAPPAGPEPPTPDQLPSPYELMMRAGINNAMQTQRFIEFMQRAMPPMATFPAAGQPQMPQMTPVPQPGRRPAPASVGRSRRIASSRTVALTSARFAVSNRPLTVPPSTTRSSPLSRAPCVATSSRKTSCPPIRSWSWRPSRSVPQTRRAPSATGCPV